MEVSSFSSLAAINCSSPAELICEIFKLASAEVLNRFTLGVVNVNPNESGL